MPKTTMVIPKDALFGLDYFEGFRPHSEVDFEKRILSGHSYRLRDDVENNPSFKQPIAYAIVVNPVTKKIFAYQRASKDKAYGEKRLQGKWSWGVGGHIEKKDTIAGNPIRESLEREVFREEIQIKGCILSIKPIGYLNYDTDSVGQVHFGILYVVETDASEVLPAEEEIAQGRMCSFDELERISRSESVENWSQIALDPLKNYFAGIATKE